MAPWLVELVSNMPVMNPSHYSPPSKKLYFPSHPDFSLDRQLSMSTFSGNTLGPRSSLSCLTDNSSPGIQGARHAQFGISLSDIHFNYRQQWGPFPPSQQRLNQFPRVLDHISSSYTKSSDSVSCLLSIGSPNPNLENPKEIKKQPFLLFGQPILTEQEISLSYSSESTATISVRSNNFAYDPIQTVKGHQNGFELRQSLSDNSSYAGFSRLLSFPLEEHNMGNGLCKVYMEDEGVGRTFDLSAMQSYQELYLKLVDIYGIEKPDVLTLNHVIYHDTMGALKCIGDEPFSDFRKSAKKLKIIVDPGKTYGMSVFTYSFCDHIYAYKNSLWGLGKLRMDFAHLKALVLSMLA